MIEPAHRAALCQATHRLRAAGIDQPAREARLLLTLALELPHGALPPSDAGVPARFWDLLDRRAAREPMARLRGSQGFWTLDLAVSPETLIPRADSETVITAALAARPDRDAVRRVLDLGTGTGALLLAALVEYPGAWGVGVDRSRPACVQAAANTAAHGLTDRACFVCADWSAPLRGAFDLILCNPPYIPSAEIAGLMTEVAIYDPIRALDGGTDGLAAYRALLPGLASVVSPGGVAVLEHGVGQGKAVADLVSATGLAVLAAPCDLAGIQRVIVAQKPFGEGV